MDNPFEKKDAPETANGARTAQRRASRHAAAHKALSALLSVALVLTMSPFSDTQALQTAFGAEKYDTGNNPGGGGF